MEDIPNGFTGFAGKRASEKGNYQYSRELQRNADIAPLEEEKLLAIPEQRRRWSWVEIDLEAIRENVLAVRRRLKPPCKLMAVVKADAYGHGAVHVAREAIKCGAEYLGVATVDEGITLRRAGIDDAHILLLSEPPIDSIPLLLYYGIMPSIYTAEFALNYGEIADAQGMTAPYHLVVNSGMNRIGVRYDEVLDFVRQIDFHRALEMKGIFTHFATADCPETLDFQVQMNRFLDALKMLHDARIPLGLVHCDNSAALLRYPTTNFDMVRLGISLYGFHPCPETRGLIDLKPAMSVHTRVTNVNVVPISDGVSYGLHYRSPGGVKICTIPVGYGDGLQRILSGNMDVLIHGQRCRQVGNICMDQCMFEVDMRATARRTRIEPRIGDDVVIIGRQGDEELTIDEMAALADTIQHEIAIGFSLRMPRFYVNG